MISEAKDDIKNYPFGKITKNNENLVKN